LWDFIKQFNNLFNLMTAICFKFLYYCDELELKKQPAHIGTMFKKGV